MIFTSDEIRHESCEREMLVLASYLSIVIARANWHKAVNIDISPPGIHGLACKKSVIIHIRASKTFVLFVLCTEAETGYFGGRQAVKGEESQYSLTEALCLFWVPPWGLYLSPVTNIHIIDRVLYCRMAFLSPIIEN